MTTLERAPDLGSTIELPNGERVIIRQVVNDSNDKPGVIFEALA